MGFESTYEELKQLWTFSTYYRIWRFESTYEELKH